GILNRIFTYPTSTPLNYVIRTDGAFRLFTQTFDGGYVGTVGLGGNLAAYSLVSAPNADTQVRDGDASLQLSVRQSSGRENDAFSVTCSYHALLRKADDT